MDLAQIHTKLLSSRLTIPVSILIAFALRILAGVPFNDIIAWIVFVLQVGIAISFMQINHNFTIIQKRTMLPTLFFLLLTSTNPNTFHDLTGNIICLGMLLCIVFMFSSYQNPNAQVHSFNIAFILTLCSIFWPPLLLTLPVFWFGMYKFKALNFKSFSASLVGVTLVSLFTFGWFFYKNNLSFLVEKLTQIQYIFTFHPDDLSIPVWIYVGFLFVLVLITRFNSYLSKTSEKIRTNTFLRYLQLWIIITLALFFFTTEFHFRWILISYIPISLILSHYFSLSISKFSSYLLLITIFIFLGMFFLLGQLN